MTGTTIRDIVIKVAVEASMDAIADRFKLIETAASKAEQQVVSLLAKIEDLDASGTTSGGGATNALDPQNSWMTSNDKNVGLSSDSTADSTIPGNFRHEARPVFVESFEGEGNHGGHIASEPSANQIPPSQNGTSAGSNNLPEIRSAASDIAHEINLLSSNLEKLNALTPDHKHAPSDSVSSQFSPASGDNDRTIAFSEPRSVASQSNLTVATAIPEKLKEAMDSVGAINVPTAPKKPGRPGYGTSVHNRAFDLASQGIEALNKTGALDDVSHQDIVTLHEGFQKKGRPLIREHDQETSNAQKDAEKEAAGAKKASDEIAKTRQKPNEENARLRERDAAVSEKSFEAEQKSAQKASDAILANRQELAEENAKVRERDSAAAEKAVQQEQQSAQKAAEEIKAHRQELYEQNKKLRDKNAAEIAKAMADEEKEYDRNAAAAIRAYSRIMAERKAKAKEKKVKDAATRNATIGTAKGAIQLVASAGDDTGSMVRQVAAIDGVANVAKNASAAIEGMGLVAEGAGALVGGLFAVLIAELMATKMAFDEAGESNRNYWHELAEDAQRASTRVSANSMRQHDLETHNAMDRPDISDARRLSTTIPAGEALEERMRGIDSNLNLTQGQRASARTFAERQHGLGVQRLETADRVADIDKRLTDLNAADEKLKTSRPQIEESSKQVVSAHTKRMEHATDETWRGTAYRQFYKAGHSLSHAMGMSSDIDQDSGMWKSQIEQKKLAENDMNRAKVSGEEKVKQVDASLNSNGIQRSALAKERVNLLAKQYGTTKEMRQAAYESVRDEKNRLEQGAIGFGGAGVAEQNRIIRMQKKHEDIEAQRKENIAAGRPADENVAQYSQWELQQGAGGSIAEESMERQKRRIAKEKGFVQRSDLKDREALAAETEKIELPNQEKTKRDLDEARASLEKLVSDFEERAEAALSINKVLESITQVMEEVQARNESEIKAFKLKFGRGG